jgi:hypothetical protein
MTDPRQHPLNQLAIKFLPAGWDDHRWLPVLSLMFWALEEARPDLVLLPGRPDPDDLERSVVNLMQGDPQATLDYLLGKEEGEGEFPLVDDLERATSPAQAASRLLQSLQGQTQR